MPEVTMPRLSDTMQEGKVARWLKQPGDRVAPGDVLAEIETDKATMELESFEAGVLDRILVPEGQSAPIGQPIAVIGAGNGAATPASPAASQPPASGAAPTGSTLPPAANASGQPPVGANPPAVQAQTRPPPDAAGAEPAAQSVGAQPPQPDQTARAGQPNQRTQPAATTTPPQEAAAQAAPSRPAAEGRAPADDGAAPTAAPAATPGEALGRAAEQTPTGEEVRASPMARAIARERGIDLRRVQGSGPGGRIIRADLEAIGSNDHAPAASAAAASGQAPTPAARSGGAVAPPDTAPAAPPQPAAPSAAASPPSAPQGDGAEPRPVGRIHQVMAERTLQSVRDIPQYYLTSEVDMQAALDLRHELEETFGSEARVTINAIVLRAVALALKEVPEVNSVWRDGQWLLHSHVHLGVAVAVPDGLIVPVVRDADRKSLREIAAETRALASRAREGKLSLVEVQGSTFSVTNLGMFDVEEFHGIINPPEAGLLAVGTVVEKPVGLDGQIVLRPRMRVTLTADHRAYSGDVGARFLQAVKRLLGQPLRLGF